MAKEINLGDFVIIPTLKREEKPYIPFVSISETQLKEWHATDKSAQNKENDANFELKMKAKNALQIMEEHAKNEVNANPESKAQPKKNNQSDGYGEIDLSIVPDSALDFFDEMEF